MKIKAYVRLVVMILGGLSLFLAGNANHSAAQEQRRPAKETRVLEFRRSIEDYRRAIKDAYRVDIHNFKDRLRGGRADGKPITNYDLKELLLGIKFEREHTDDNLLALEMAMDHLETVPDYYTRHQRLEAEIISEKLLDQ